jgi:hypothetical protein
MPHKERTLEKLLILNVRKIWGTCPERMQQHIAEKKIQKCSSWRPTPGELLMSAY